MSESDLRKAFRTYKREERLKLNKKYPKGGREFIKAVNKLAGMKFSDFKGMKKLGVKVATKSDIPVKTTSNKNIVKANFADPKFKKKKEDKKSVVVKKKEDKKVTSKRKGNPAVLAFMKKNQYTSKEGGKPITAAQRLAEIDAEKAKDKKAAGMEKLKQMIKTAVASKKPTKVASKSKEKEKIVLKKGGMTKRGR